MADTFDQFFSGQEAFGAVAREFGDNVGKFSIAVALMGTYLKDQFGSFKEMIKDLGSKLTEFGQVFTSSHIILTIKQLIGSYERGTVKLAKQLGIVGKQRFEYLGDIREVTEQTLRLGASVSDNFETAVGLAKNLRQFNVFQNKELLYTTTLLERALGLSTDGAVQLSASMVRFQGSSGKEIRDFFQDIANLSVDANVSYQAVAESLSSSAGVLGLFNLRSAQSKRDFKASAVYLTGIGSSLDQAVNLNEQFRNIAGSMEGAARLTQLGLNVGPMQLLREARSGDPAAVTRLILTRFQKTFGTDFSNQITRDMAIQTAQVMGMNLDQFMLAAKENQKMLDVIAKTGVTLEEYAKANMTIGDQLNALYKTVLDGIASPLAQVILPAAQKTANFFAELIKTVGTLPVLIGGVLAIAVAKPVVAAILKLALASGKRLGAGIISKMFKGGPGVGNFMGLPGGGQAEGAAGKGGGGAVTKKMMMSMPKPAQLFGSAAAMIAFAAGIWILSKAFQNFSEGVSWKGVGVGVTVMAAFVGSMALVTAIMSTAAGPIAIGTVLLLGMAGALWVSSKAFQNFTTAIVPLHDVNLIQIAQGIAAIGGALTIFGAGAMAAGISNIVSLFTGGDPLTRLGKWAEKYRDPLRDVASSVEIIAMSIGNLAESVAAVDLTKAKAIMSEINSSDLVGAVVGGGGQLATVPIQNRIRIDIDGEKVAAAMVKSTGVR
jgi:hypothetical protein